MSDTNAEFTGPALRKLKSLGQLLEPAVMIGKAGLTAEFYRNLSGELDARELVKVRFAALKDQKKTLVPRMAAETRSQLVMRVGNTAVLYRQNADPAKRKIPL